MLAASRSPTSPAIRARQADVVGPPGQAAQASLQRRPLGPVTGLTPRRPCLPETKARELRESFVRGAC
jgi:hypothetical protein